jgi:transcriptional regulator with XRE-family HTH domain
MPSSPLPFREQLQQLAKAKGLSVGGVGYQAYSPSGRGTSPDTLRKVMAGKRKLNDALIEAIAGVLEVDPNVFVEYRLSRLRRNLDEDPEKGVGFQRAAAMLAGIEEAVGAMPADRRELKERMTRELAVHAQPGRTPNDAAATKSHAHPRKAQRR